MKKIILIITIALVAVGYYYCTFNLLYTVFLVISLFLINVLGERFKLLIDLNNPQIKWDTEYTMMKQNTNVMYELFYTIIIIIAIEAIGLLINNVILNIVISLIVLIIANAIVTSYVSKNKEKIFNKLY